MQLATLELTPEELGHVFSKAKGLFIRSAEGIKEGTALLCDIGDVISDAKDRLPEQWTEWLATHAPDVTLDQAAACIRYASKRKEGTSEASICRQVMLDFGITPQLETTQRTKEASTKTLSTWAGTRAATLLDQATAHLTEALRARPLNDWTEVEKREWLKRTDPIIEFRNSIS
jgi:hypothetical protein